MNTTTKAQRINKRHDAIWEACNKAQKAVAMEFEQSDAVELFHIIRSRGFGATRSKLLEVLFQLDKEMAERINREDNFDTLAAEMARQS